MADAHPNFDVALVTPDGAVFDGAAQMIVVPGAAGEIGVLARHAPLVATLKAHGRYETSLHREVFRPWGSYDSIDQGERFQVKRLVVKPGASLSLQLHHHRAEHWIIVSGTARITRGDEVFLLGENESTYIPMGTKHRIENPGMIPLHIIEVQSGTYLGEDDIVRFEDRYGRDKQ